MANCYDAVNSQKYPGPSLPTLNHIRLVSLLPGSTNTITCELITVDIDSAPKYEALSYTWGNAFDRQAIRIQNTVLQQSAELLATSNCLSALRRLRYRDQPRMLWIDSLSINQLDVSEKNHQITLMSKIFSQAANVIIYLGEPADNSDLAIEFITECDNPSTETTSLSYPNTELLTGALYSFFHRPWFTRVWVIQEVVLSNTALAYCGEKTIPWSAIQSFKDWNIASRRLQQLPFIISASKESLIKGNVESSIFTALNRTRHCDATNQRDKVYALLPLFQSLSKQFNMIPKYGDTVAKVYTDCAIALLPECGFKLLSAVQGKSSIGNLPSWVPDWSIPRKCSHLGIPSSFGVFERKVNDKVAPQLITHYSTINGENAVSLRVAGHFCGRILDVGSTYIAGRGLLPILEWQRLAFNESVVCPKASGKSRSKTLERTFYAVLAAFSYDFLGERLYDFFKLHLLHGLYANYETDWAKEVRKMGSLRSDQRVIGASILPFEDIPFHLAAREITPTYKIYIQSVLRACHSRRFFITDTGYMGIAPDNAKIMDHVYICAGATAPFVFRRIDGKLPEQEEGQFRLIGECHLEKMAWDVFENAPNALEYLEIV